MAIILLIQFLKRKTIGVLSFLLIAFSVFAQNPFLENASIIHCFDVSPDGKKIVCSWWGKEDKGFKILLKDLTTDELQVIDAVEKQKQPYAAVCFTGTDAFFFLRYDETLYKYTLSDKTSQQWANLPNDFFVVGSMVSNPLGNQLYLNSNIGMFFIDGRTAYSVRKLSPPLGLDNGMIFSLGYWNENQLMLSVMRKVLGGERKMKLHTQMMNCTDGKLSVCQITFTEHFSSPYIVQPTLSTHQFIVVDKKGLFLFDEKKGVKKLLSENSKENPIEEVKVSHDLQYVYYKTMRRRTEIVQLDIEILAKRVISFK